MCACCDFGEEVLVELNKERRMHIRMAREVSIAAQEGHDVPM